MKCYRISDQDIFFPKLWACEMPNGRAIIAASRQQAITEAINFYFVGALSTNAIVI